MASDNEDISDISAGQHEYLSTTLMDLIKEYPILLEKSQLPRVKEQKAASLEQAKIFIAKNTGRKMDGKQVLKKIANMKARVKKKMEANRTGNSTVTLCEWELELCNIMYGEKYPTTVTKISPSLFAGYRRTGAGTTSRRLGRFPATAQPYYPSYKDIAWGRPSSSNSPNTRPSSSHSMPQPFRRQKRRILSAETVETVGLSMTELQRLVLLEKLRYTRMKMRCLEQSQQPPAAQPRPPTHTPTTSNQDVLQPQSPSVMAECKTSSYD